MGKDVKFPSLSVRKYEGFRTMFMCPFLTGYRPPYFLSCFLSREKDRAVQELSFIRRFIKTQRPSSFTVYVHQNLRPEIVSLLQDTEVRRFRLCSAAALGFQPGVRKHPQRHFESGVWNHLTSFSAQSPCMFTALGQRIILAITQGGSIEELRLTDTTISGKAWNSLLSKLTVPKLSVFEVEGRVTLKALWDFLSRHRTVKELKIGDPIRTPIQSIDSFSLPSLTRLRAPGSSALPFLRGSRAIKDLGVVFEGGSSTSRSFREFLKYLPETGVSDVNLDVDSQSVLVLEEDCIERCFRRVECLSLNLGRAEFPNWLLVSSMNSGLLKAVLTCLALIRRLFVRRLSRSLH